MKKDIIITIGRQFGSGGKCVAEVLGRKLGIPVYDQELIMKAAQESGFSAEFIAQRAEKRRIFSLSSIFATAYSSETENYMSDKGLFRIQCETIRNIAGQGAAGIVGRCSDYVLRDMEIKLDVFLTSPLEKRAARVAERQGIDYAKAMETVEREDRNREEYYIYYTFGNWGVASNYDLCIDSDKLGDEGTADMIIEFARKAGLL